MTVASVQYNTATARGIENSEPVVTADISNTLS